MTRLPHPAPSGVHSVLPQYGFFLDVEWMAAFPGLNPKRQHSVRWMRDQIRTSYRHRIFGYTLILHTVDFYAEEFSEYPTCRQNFVAPRLPQSGVYFAEQFADALSLDKRGFTRKCKSLGVPMKTFHRENLLSAEQFFAALPVVEPRRSSARNGQETQ
ncbi:hypothetical protein KOR42_22540 [Thalassoglobus neptunius]|uniref:Uncharacterized protein n=1 Tax=Thalassoglobus neptunius TaxID=1938619 RepID=A0A5C5X6X7_9PLAN|nr:hypothetical protein [Thalassoglobus neptunius]TWT58867.1 hypothetical protein KOR42_22540 [Thalassoglobus neptunius]